MQAAAAPLDSGPSQIDAVPRWGAVDILVLILAIVETLSALTNLPILFGNLSEVPGPGLFGWTITAVVVLSPFAAIAALVFTLKGRIRHAIMAIATLALLGWLNYLPSYVLHGLPFDSPLPAAHTLAQFFVFPIAAIAAISLATRNERLMLAAILAGLPTLTGVLGVVAFGIGVAIYGF